MGETSIQWTDKVWNCVTGCTKVSPGCKHCYAEGVAERFWATQYPPVECERDPGDIVPFHQPALRPRRFTDVQCHEDRLLEPLKWRKPSRVFVNSMSDLFHEDVPDAFIDQVFAVMALAPRHTFQILTKRAERMRDYVLTLTGSVERMDDIDSIISDLAHDEIHATAELMAAADANLQAWPLRNVWLGVSVENQHFADERIPLLLQTPTAVRFISAEPLLGPVDIRDWLKMFRLDWVIVGGESGRKARPFHIDWARDLITQCQSAGVSCFVKQLGSDPRHHVDWWKFDTLKDRKGGDISEWPSDLQVREFPGGQQHGFASGAALKHGWWD